MTEKELGLQLLKGNPRVCDKRPEETAAHSRVWRSAGRNRKPPSAFQEVLSQGQQLEGWTLTHHLYTQNPWSRNGV